MNRPPFATKTAVVRPGKVTEITSTANPVIKSIKSLALKKNRDTDGIFIAEGLKLVTDALAGGWTARNLIYSARILDEPELGQIIETIAAQILAAGGNILKVNDKVLTSITRRDNPQMVVGVFEKKWSNLTEVKPGSDEHPDLWLALDRVRDPGNLGTIIRTADAVGVAGVILVGNCTDPFGIEAVRATMGSLFHVPLIECSEDEFLIWLKTWPGISVGTHLEGAIDHRSINYSDQSTIIVMGNEQQGLPQTIADACDQLALIAMEGQADSLNLAIATGIMVFEARRHELGVPK